MNHVTITVDFDVEEGIISKSFITGVVKGEFLSMLCLERSETKNMKVKTKIIKDKAI